MVELVTLTMVALFFYGIGKHDGIEKATKKLSKKKVT
jgi:hypothetical protein